MMMKRTLVAIVAAQTLLIQTLGLYAQEPGGYRPRPGIGVIRDQGGQVFNVKSPPYSAIGDGSNHPLSERYPTLAAAQAVYPTATSLTTDLIDSMAIQKALNASNAANGPAVFLPAGKYVTSDTIQVGYGVTTSSVVLEGAGYMYRATTSSAFNGTAIVPTFSDRPAIAVQGARGSVIRGISIVGLNEPYISAQGLASDSPLIDDTSGTNWKDPALDSRFDSRYAPYAGIAIDPYCGTRPGTSYPDVTYPASMGAVSQYGKQASIDVLIEDCYIAGFAVAIANQPSDFDGNGDRTKLRRVFTEKNKYTISVGNSQSRNLDIAGLDVSYTYTAITNNQHGKQSGKLGGVVNDMTAFRLINVVNILSAFASSLTFNNFYGESLWRIGTITSNSANEKAITWQSCEFSFGIQNDTRGVPATVIDGGVQQIPLVFRECYFEQYPSVFQIYQFGALYVNCYLRKDTRTNSYEQFAHNALAGGLVTPQLINPRGSRIKSKYYDLDAGTITTGPIWTGPYQTNARRNVCACLYSDQIGASSDESAPPIRMPVLVNQVAKSSQITNATLTNKTLQFDFTGTVRDAEWKFYHRGGLPGDVIWDNSTNSVFFIRSRSGATVIAELQNNYKSNGSGGYTPITSIPLNTGTFFIGVSRFYTPAGYLRGDTTSGSATIATVGRDDGSATFDSEITAGDYVWVNTNSDNWVSQSSSLINSESQASTNIVLSASTGMRTATRRRLDLFIRQPPANQ